MWCLNLPSKHFSIHLYQKSPNDYWKNKACKCYGLNLECPQNSHLLEALCLEGKWTWGYSLVDLSTNGLHSWAYCQAMRPVWRMSLALTRKTVLLWSPSLLLGCHNMNHEGSPQPFSVGARQSWNKKLGQNKLLSLKVTGEIFPFTSGYP